MLPPLFDEETMQPKIPILELKKLHTDLTMLETLVQLIEGGYTQARPKIQDIYAVQEMIENIIREEKNK